MSLTAAAWNLLLIVTVSMTVLYGQRGRREERRGGRGEDGEGERMSE
jgi:hypothetical protein